MFSKELTNDVAVIGMACRVAGGNDSQEQLWESIMEKIGASGEVPSWRWEPHLRRDARNAKELSKTTSRGYFLKILEDFDAAFFGISPKEAKQMDPQQRLSLEVAWEALENAGIPPQSLSESDTAVFMGVNSDDYSKLLLEDLPGIDAWMGIGTGVLRCSKSDIIPPESHGSKHSCRRRMCLVTRCNSSRAASYITG